MKKAKGQSMVEFALVIPVFLALMAGLLDGGRLLFTYNELQEAARVGARWGAVEVGRDCWGAFTDPGNVPGTIYQANANPNISTLCVGAYPHTIVGEVATKLVAVDKANTSVLISNASGCNLNQTEGGTSTVLSGCAVGVQVSYKFMPVLGFGRMGINLTGKAVLDHE